MDLFIDSERNLNNIVRKIRTALGDVADRPRFVETVIGKGYRFTGPVRVIGAQYPRGGLDEMESVRRENGSARWERTSLACFRPSSSGRAAMMTGFAWDLPKGWHRGWAICGASMCCQSRQS